MTSKWLEIRLAVPDEAVDLVSQNLMEIGCTGVTAAETQLDTFVVPAPENLINDPALRAAVDAGVDRVNREHAPVEQIKRWRLLSEPFSVEGGELTPTMKVKRSVVIEQHTDAVEEMYTDDRR